MPEGCRVAERESPDTPTEDDQDSPGSAHLSAFRNASSSERRALRPGRSEKKWRIEWRMVRSSSVATTQCLKTSSNAGDFCLWTPEEVLDQKRLLWYGPKKSEEKNFFPVAAAQSLAGVRDAIHTT